jgi:transcriptional regulator with XRE-family HTH domain
MTKKIASPLGQNIRLLRKQKGLTQVELAKNLDCSQAVITAYESGKKKPAVDTLSRLADVLGVTTDQIIGKKNVPQQKNPVKSPKLWKKFSQVEQLPITDKRTIFKMIDGLISQKKHRTGTDS